MINNDLVSVIVPTFNSENFIIDCLESIKKQTYSPIEIILIDDNSSDKTEETIKLYIKKNNMQNVIYIKNHINLGAATSRNKGISLANGRFISFLDSDDVWLPEKLEKQIKFMSDKKSKISCTSYFKITEKSIRYHKIIPPKIIDYKRLLRSCPVGCLTVIYDTHYLGKIFFTETSKREDYATWLNLTKKIDCIDGLQEPLAEYRTYKSQSSAKKIKMAKENWRIYREIEKITLIKSIYYFIQYSCTGILNTYKPKIIKSHEN